MIYVLDSNIVSYLIKEDVGVAARYLREFEKGNDFVIPPIVYYEVKRWLLANDLDKRYARFKVLCQKIRPVEFDWSVWETATELYAQLSKQGKPIDDFDLFIAAFCLENGYALVTNNTRHFKRIDGLELVNWKE